MEKNTLHKNPSDYSELLKREEWRVKRRKILERDGYTCLICGSSNDLAVHHRQYHFDVSKNQFVLPWNYKNRNLITLCKYCHEAGHKKFKVPTFNINPKN